MIKRLDLDIGTLELYEFYAVGSVNEALNFDIRERSVFLDACLEHFGNKPFGYISLRKNPYSINPLVYLDLNTVENLKAVAIVPYSVLGDRSAEIEQKLFKKPFGIFANQMEAVLWIQEALNNP